MRRREVLLGGVSLLALSAPAANALIFRGGTSTTGGGGGGGSIVTRTINNADSSSLPATAFWQVGQPFKAGDVPSGSIVTATVGGVSVPVQGMGLITHNDGSLAWCDLHINLSGISIAGAGTSSLVLTAAAGSWSTTTSRTNTNWTALADTVEVSGVTTTGTSGNNMDKAGTYIATFDAGVTNTIESYGQGPLGLHVLVRADLVNTGSTHQFLQAVMEYWVCQKADTSLGPIASRGPWIENTQLFKADPSRFNFNLAWKRATVTQRSWTDVRTHCGSIAVGCRNDGLWDWTANEPVVFVTQDYTQTRATKKIPPFKTGLSYTPVSEWSASISTSTGLVTATGAFNYIFGANSSGLPTGVTFRGTSLPSGSGFGAGNIYWAAYQTADTVFLYDTLPHAIAGGATGKLIPTGAGSGLFVRPGIGPLARGDLCNDLTATGPRFDLGLMTEWGCAYHVANTQAAQLQARANAWAMCAMGIALRNDATGKIPGLLPTAQLPAGLGTGVETLTALGGTCSSQIGSGAGTFTGGGGQFTVSFCVDGSHLPHPLYPVWVMEGGAYLRQVIYYNGNQSIIQKAYLPNRNLQVNGTGTTYYGTVITEGGTAMRVGAWAFLRLGYAAFAAPDGSDEKSYFVRVLKNNLDWQVADRAFKGANYQTMGIFLFDSYSLPSRRDLTICSNFMSWYMSTALGMVSLLLGDNSNLSTNLSAFIAAYSATWLAGMFNTYCPFFASGYEWGPLYTESNYVGSYADVGNVGGADTHYDYATSGTITWSLVDPETTLANGDYFYPYDIFTETGGGATAPPANLTIGRRYYVRDVNVGAKTFGISATNGGALITYSGAVSGSGGSWHFLACPSSGTAAGTASDTDGYQANAVAAMAISSVAGGGSNCDSAYTAAGLKCTANFNTGVSWAFQNTA